jgi:hypothetical protein
MRGDRNRQVDERVDLLQLARPGDRQQALHGALTVITAIAEHDLSPLDGGSRGALGGIIRWLDTGRDTKTLFVFFVFRGFVA